MEMPNRIDLLVVDDDAEFRATVVRRFSRRGYQVQEAPDGVEALALAERRQFDVAIVDMVMPKVSGLELLERLKTAHAECEVIMLTGQGSIEAAVKAMKMGAYDFLTKPFPLAELEVLIEKAVERRQLAKENVQLKEVLQRRQAQPEMIGESAGLKEVWRLIERAGPTDKAILIEGESGTGKELVARALHRHSPRADKPLIVINCAALPETLLESELFGHEKGSFTGAINAKPGLFEVADGGTLFIDEIGEMPGSLQAKLLRVLEDGSMRRIGSVKERRVNVRLLAATNRNLATEVKAGRFREDLYYRINVMSLTLPPLRERTGDVPLLVRRFLGSDWLIEPAAMQALEHYHWPGNVRQLINALERAKIMADGGRICLDDLPRELCADKADGARLVVGGSDALSAVERAHIVEVLKRERGNKARTARALGLNRRSLYRLLEKYSIKTAEEANPSPI
jgi:DNA-binding NtrC family response regulator